MNWINNLSNKTLILLLILLFLIIYIFFYKREYLLSDTDITNLMNARCTEINNINNDISIKLNKDLIGVKIDTEDIRLQQINKNKINFNFNRNYIYTLCDIPNKKIMEFYFDNSIKIYDFNTNQVTTYFLSYFNKPEFTGSNLRIINDGDGYSISISFNKSDGSGMGTGIKLNKQDLFNVNNFINILNNNNNFFMVKNYNFNPANNIGIAQANIIGNIDDKQTTQQTYDGDVTVIGKNQQPATATSVMVKHPIYDCLPEDTFKKIQNNFEDLINSTKSLNYDNKFDNIVKLVLNFNNYNIIKNQIEIFKTLSDDQIVCLLERNDPNFCNDFNNSISRDEIKQIEYNLKSIYQILNLYQNQILDVKNIILPRLLVVINKCTNLTKENKIKILNIFKNILYIAEYISYFLGNNWDLIKKIDDTIKNIN